ncbi:MAG TPA: hypothetical protein VGL38_05930 [bacterium]
MNFIDENLLCNEEAQAKTLLTTGMPSMNGCHADHSHDDLTEEILEKFVSRDDCVGQATTMSTPVSGRADVVKRLQKHLSGELRLGLYDLLPDGTAQWAVVEFEDHDGDTAWEDICLANAFRYQQELKALGIPSLLERSKNLNGRCYHLHIRLDEPLSARLIRDSLRDLGRKLFGPFQNEIFPKGDNGIGHFVWLPLFGGAEDTIYNKSREGRRGGGVPTSRTVFIDETGAVYADQRAALNAWDAANAKQFADRMLPLQAHTTAPASSSKQGTGIEQNQPGLEKMEANCPIIKKWVESPIGWRYDHWLGIASNYVVFKGGWERFVELSRKDTANFSQREIDRILDEVLAFHGPQTYEKFREQGLEFELPAGSPKAPAGWRTCVDLDALLGRILAAKGNEQEELTADCFREEFPVLSAGKQDRLLADLEKRGGIPGTDLRRMARESLKVSCLVGRDLRELLPRLRVLGATPEDLGEVIFRWFTENGGKCYRDRDHIGYLVWKDKAYEIGPNQPYRSLLWEVARITDKGIDSQKMLAAICAEVDLKAKVVEFFTWLHSDTSNHVLYLHPNRHDDQLVQVDCTGVRLVPNGNNDHEVILTAPTKMKPADLIPMDDAGYKAAWQDFNRLILQNMASSRSNQLMAACWAICYPFMDYVKSCPHLRFEGRTKRGKTRAMDLIGYFIYGDQQYTTSATTASIFSNASVNPLFMYDNLETKNITQEISDLLLTIVSGGQREKRDMTTAHGVIEERTHCLACTTGIENLNLPEQINRTLTIPVDHYEYSSPGWSDRMYELIKAKRSEMFTAHMRIVSRVLCRMSLGEMEARVDWIRARFPKDHDKDRVNSYLALMTLVAEELLPIIEPQLRVDDLLVTWIQDQDESGGETARESSPIVMYLEALHKKAKRMKVTDSDDVLGQDWPYNVDCKKREDGHYTMSGIGADFLLSFGQIAREKGQTAPYKNAQQFVRRLKDAEGILKDRGITFTSRKNREDVSVYTFEFPAPEQKPASTGGGESNAPKKTYPADVLEPCEK